MFESRAKSLPFSRPLILVARWLAVFFLAFVALWAALAVWFQAPLPANGRALLGALFAATFLLAAFSLATGRWLRWTGPAAVAFGLLLALWWGSIYPRQDRNWIAEASRGAVITIRGDDIEVRNVRFFTWTGAETAEPRWESRLYSLSALRSLDLFTSHWGNDNIAHAILSFSFAQGPPLALSVEIRREVGEEYSPIAGFFKKYETVLIAADESDIIKVRTNRRNEVVYRYRIDAKPENIAKLLMKYAELSQSLAENPQFYHTIWTNCTTRIYAMLRQISPADFPMDLRVLISGRVPEYLYDIGFLDRTQPFEEIRRRADITLRARLADTDSDFSTAIRR